MTDLTTQVQSTDLQAIQDDDLVAVQGGGWKTDLFKEYVAKPVARHAFQRMFG